MNGYFVTNEVLDILDQLAYLQDMMAGLTKIPEEYKGQDLEEQIKACEDTIESLQYDLGDLAEWIAGDIRNADMESKAYKGEVDAWRNKQYRAERRMKSEKSLLMLLMKKAGLTKMDAGKFKLTIANNGGKTPIEYTVDPEELPAKFRIREIVYKPDDAAIREYLDSGKKSKYFSYGERGYNLRVK